MFHISLSEAVFITENYENYFFGRVFPLLTNEKYYGVQIASNWGVNFCRLNLYHRDEFQTAVNEVKNISQGEGFLIKPEWLVNISLKTIDDLVRLFPENRETPCHHTLIDYCIDAGLFKNHKLFAYFVTDSLQNYRVTKLVVLLSLIVKAKGESEYKILLEKNGLSDTLKLWNSDKLEKFIINCDYSDINLIKCFIIQLLILTSDKSIEEAIYEAKIYDITFIHINSYPKFNYLFSHIPELNNIVNSNDIDITFFTNPYCYESKQVRDIPKLLLKHYSEVVSKEEKINNILVEMKKPATFLSVNKKLASESSLEMFRQGGLTKK